eukprot:NODE_20052_length_267_cov_1.500000_g18883_i0.p2 GENE.NODE_20052_length_267_cov_1.500000_g18883_i0~~NODE_20052_length_267_cov_1.500000_g18883_i0.p2  ORF type:complete len:53 (+),score=15.13 NODE_20052_length_267_cov_1.500000_g18883_i0:99-257(+)
MHDVWDGLDDAAVCRVMSEPESVASQRAQLNRELPGLRRADEKIRKFLTCGS